MQWFDLTLQIIYMQYFHWLIQIMQRCDWLSVVDKLRMAGELEGLRRHLKVFEAGFAKEHNRKPGKVGIKTFLNLSQIG